MAVYFISGSDTDVGKSVATGWLAKRALENGAKITTQKLIQTGCEGISEDVLTHRRIMGIAPDKFDTDLTTCPCVYSYPCSPHLAAIKDNKPIDFAKILRCTKKLEKHFDTVLLEGAGGLMVPLTENFLTIDYIAAEGYPVILVVSGKLGGINHALLSLDACKRRGIEVAQVVFNEHGSPDKFISEDAKKIISSRLKSLYPDALFEVMPELEF